MATVPELRAAGFSDDEIASWAEKKRNDLDAAGFDAHEINNYLTGVDLPREVPKPFLERFLDHRMEAIKNISKDVEQGFGDEPVGLSEKNVQILRDIGLFNKPGETSPLRTAYEVATRSTASAVDALMRGVNAGITGLGSTVQETAAMAGVESPERLKRDTIALANVLSIAAGSLPHPVFKPKVNELGQVHDVPVGKVPEQMDFVDANTVLRAPDQNKLVELYKEKGIHPAEVVDDAKTDPTVKQDMASVNPGLPERYVGKYEEPEITRTEIAPEQEVIPPETKAGGGGGGPPRIEGPVIENEPGPIPIEGPPKAPLSLDEAYQKILDHMSIGEHEPRQGFSFSRLYTNFLDQFNPIKKLDREFTPKGMSPEESPYVAYRMLTGSVTQAHDMIMGSGVPDFAKLYERGVRPEDVPTVAESLRKIMEPVRDAEELDKFRAFAAAARTIELERRGIETGFDLEAARTVARGAADKYAGTLAELIDFQNKVSAALVESGIISREARAGMLQQNLIYTPFYRVFQDESTMGAGRTMQPRNPLNAIKGSEREVIDPLESIIKNTYLYNQMANRNLAAQSLADLMERMGLSEKQEVGMIPALAPEHVADLAAYLEYYGTPKATADQFAVFIQTAMDQEGLDAKLTVFRDGKKFLYDVDPEIARVIKGLDKETVNSLARVIGQWTSVLKAGALLVPEFGARHVMRDYFYALVTSPGGFSPLNMVRGLMHQIKQDQVYQDWTRSGAANVTMQAFDRRWLQEDIRKLTEDTGLMTRGWNVVASPEMSVSQKAGITLRAMIHPLQVWMEIAQSASHVGAFEKALNRGASMREAAWESRETAVDISRRGAKMQAWNLVSAFANATIQDTDRWVRELSPRDPKKAAGAAFKIAAGITAPSAMLWALNHDDADWKEIPQWEKDIFWLIPVGATAPSQAQIAQAQLKNEPPKASAWAWMRVPKPFGMGVIFGSGAERTLDALYAHKPEAFKDFASSLFETTVPSILPTPFVPIMEQWGNRSMFTGRPLIPKSLENELPEYQFTNYTTETSQVLGHLLGYFKEGGVSPITIEHYVQGWTGQAGVYALNTVDYGLRKLGLINDPSLPDKQLADIPFIRAFVARYPSATTQSLEDFHEEFDRRTKLFTTFMAQAKAGDEEAMKNIMDMGGPATFARLQGMNLALTRMSQTVRGIYKNPDIPGVEKRQLIDTIYGQMSVVAKTGNQVFRATKAP